jgi:plastocyanin
VNLPAPIASKPFYTRLALLGFVLYLCLVATYVIVSAINGSSGDAIFSIIVGIPAIIAVALILRFGSWALIFGALASLVGILFFGPSAPLGLGNPDSFFDFISVTVGLFGLVIALIACIVSFLRRRSQEAGAAGSPAVVMAVRVVLAFVVISGVASAVLTVANKETVSAAEKQGATVVTASKSEWSTDSIEASSSGTLKLLIKNSDPYLHTFTVKDLNMDFKMKPGSEKLIVLNTPLAGTHQFKCNIHDNMTGTITVH